MSRILEAFEKLYESDNHNHTAEVADFLSVDPNIDIMAALNTFKLAADSFYSEYKNILAKEDDYRYLDDIYQMKKDFYNKYIDFAKRCKELSSISGITGYGKDDTLRYKLMELCRGIDYNFPYGWK